MPARLIERMEGADLPPIDRISQRLMTTQELESSSAARRRNVTNEFMRSSSGGGGGTEEVDDADLLGATSRTRAGDVDEDDPSRIFFAGSSGRSTGGDDGEFDDRTITEALLSGIDVAAFNGGLDTTIATAQTAKEQLVVMFRTATQAL